MISPQSIDKIVDQALVEDVVGEFVTLKKRGANLLGLCPFHAEKTPSFTVTPAKNIFKCFGCGKGGDAITFLMEHEKFSYPEALRYLAQKYQIEIKETEQHPAYEEQKLERESLYGCNQFAASYFQQHLVDPISGSSIGLSYYQERGIKQETIDQFQLGFAHSKWDDLAQHALKQGYHGEQLVKAGLCLEEGGLHDKFRQRIVFPIQSLSGQIVGFGGRTLKTDTKEAKYLNTSETEIYSKSKVLYGLNFAKKSIKTVDECYVVEGYFDVIALHQEGIENTVATCGTSLTKEQINIIKRFTPNITLLYDGDAAGVKATLRAIDMVLEENMHVRMLSFPENHDPDSFIKEFGQVRFKEYVQQKKQDFILFKSNFLLKDTENDPILRASAIAEVIDSIALIPDTIRASIYIKEVARLFDLSESSVLNEYNKKRVSKAQKNTSKSSVFEELGVENPVPELPLPNIIKSSIYEQEREVIRILLRYGEYKVHYEHETEQSVTEYVLGLIMDDIRFENEVFKDIFSHFVKAYNDNILLDANTLLKVLPQYAGEITFLISDKHELSDNWKKNKVYVLNELDKIQKTCISAIHHLKFRKLLQLRSGFVEQLKKEKDIEQLMKIQLMIIEIDKLKTEIAKDLSITVF